jgi:hypothetical protein
LSQAVGRPAGPGATVNSTRLSRYSIGVERTILASENHGNAITLRSFWTRVMSGLSRANTSWLGPGDLDRRGAGIDRISPTGPVPSSSARFSSPIPRHFSFWPGSAVSIGPRIVGSGMKSWGTGTKMLSPAEGQGNPPTGDLVGTGTKIAGPGNRDGNSWERGRKLVGTGTTTRGNGDAKSWERGQNSYLTH